MAGMKYEPPNKAIKISGAVGFSGAFAKTHCKLSTSSLPPTFRKSANITEESQMRNVPIKGSLLYTSAGQIDRIRNCAFPKILSFFFSIQPRVFQAVRKVSCANVTTSSAWFSDLRNCSISKRINLENRFDMKCSELWILSCPVVCGPERT